MWASSMNQDKDEIEKLNFSGKSGNCFQIKDDLFDYTQSSLIETSTGIDIREQKK